MAGGDLAVGLRGLRERVVGGHRDEREQLRIEALDAREVDARQPLGRQRARFDPARLLRGRARTRCRRRAMGVQRRARRSTKRSCFGPCTPGPADALRRDRRMPRRRRRDSPSCKATLRGPVRRSARPAIDVGQLPAAISRCAGVIATCASFSASANVAGEIAGPAAGALPKVGGAPGVAAPGGGVVGARARRRPAGRSALGPGTVDGISFTSLEAGHGDGAACGR